MKRRAVRQVMAICLHPYLIGVPHRIAGLDSAPKYMRSHAGVWFATGEEIVRHWLQSRDNVLTAASVVLPTARARGN